jgi:hypothetical protein
VGSRKREVSSRGFSIIEEGGVIRVSIACFPARASVSCRLATPSLGCGIERCHFDNVSGTFRGSQSHLQGHVGARGGVLFCRCH